MIYIKCDMCESKGPIQSKSFITVEPYRQGLKHLCTDECLLAWTERRIHKKLVGDPDEITIG